MAGNAARKAPPPAPSSKLVDVNLVKKALDVADGGKKIILKVKKPAPKSSIPGNWKESELLNEDKVSSATPKAATESVNPADETMLAGLPTGRPLEDKPDTLQCKYCRRPILRSASAQHIRECLNKKQEKLKKKKEAKEAKDAALRKEKGEDDDCAPRKSAGKGAIVGEGAKKGKKRKIDADAEKAPNAKKKKKDEPKSKAAKPKGPVDVEKQCGVALPNGGFCARSLTCKSHSMGLKRAVPGRSLPYDMLLAQYQKKNQAKQQRAAIDANAPLPEDLEPSGAVDSEEEKESIMAALIRHRPRPLATSHPVLQKHKYQYIRMKDMLRSALGGPHGGSIFGTMTPSTENVGSRGLALNMLGAPSSATNETFPSSAGGLGGGFAQPLSAGVDGSSGMNPGNKRQSSISMAGPSSNGPRHILPGQLPGPSPAARKSSVASVASVGPS
ncbi:SCA7-domain-containing protein [Westerdykella ornata]|uniref:SCA7-domain-containing protein n=1 Tax=Westerdykella ornata TaxID=318751 RepID=A0A6A6JNI8_WESOR|nr:SCA7-domain-containing protein [Westerdykella ornata]KAF2277795.1 SCA7-domain-containing protein [Westerdykella ornata]